MLFMSIVLVWWKYYVMVSYCASLPNSTINDLTLALTMV